MDNKTASEQAWVKFWSYATGFCSRLFLIPLFFTLMLNKLVIPPVLPVHWGYWTVWCLWLMAMWFGSCFYSKLNS